MRPSLESSANIESTEWTPRISTMPHALLRYFLCIFTFFFRHFLCIFTFFGKKNVYVYDHDDFNNGTCTNAVFSKENLHVNDELLSLSLPPSLSFSNDL